MSDLDHIEDDAEVALFTEDEFVDDAVKKRLGWGFWLAIGWMVLITLLAIFGPALGATDDVNAGPPRESPSADHWFGTDALGRDVFDLTVLGARVSLTVGVVAVVVGMIVGGSLGIVAGFFRGRPDQFVSFMFFTLLSFPGLVLALLITSTFNRSLLVVCLTLGVLAIAPVGRLARAATLVFADREFVQASRVVGARNWRIVTRELLPNVAIPMSALALLGMGVAIVAEGGLAFLQLSVEDQVSWGTIINDGRSIRDLQNNPWVALCPIGVMFLTILALNFAGDRVREYFDVRETAF